MTDEARPIVTKEKMSKIVDGTEELQKKNMELGESSAPPCPPLLTPTLQKNKEVRDEKNQQHAEAKEPLKLIVLYPPLEAVTRIGTQSPLTYQKALRHKDIFT